MEKHVAELVGCPEWVALESGRASRADYDRFLGNVIRTHLKSPQLIAFLYALAPPASTRAPQHRQDVPLPAVVHELPTVAAKFRPARGGIRRQAIQR